MTKRMLIDTTHAEETRVVVLDGNRLDDYDVETAAKKQLKGNIYLAKIVRIEPSLQAAFVEYGGNRHGFLAFSEIHPDYYQIPVADRERLIALQEEEARAEEARADREDDEAEADAEQAPRQADSRNRGGRREGGRDQGGRDQNRRENGRRGGGADAAAQADGVRDAPLDPFADADRDEGQDAGPDAGNDIGADTHPDVPVAADALPENPAETGNGNEADARGQADDDRPVTEMPLEIEADTVVADTDADLADAGEDGDEDEPDGDGASPPETVSGDSADDGQAQRRTARFLRQYKIQEVMRRRQIILVQVVKEERGNKGAALTTYISLAGRFSVLMPNSPRGGGVSRKITSAADRRRLKEITEELEIPRGMGMIVRTAGAQRPRAEIRRDGEYLLRTWDDIRETTLASTAPCLVYEEASLIKRAIRDVYTRDVEEIVVDGEAGWKSAREFMRTLMPANVNKVGLWRDGGQTLFGHHGVEHHLDAMLQPTVQLRSGGYLVINQTEALVAIDVNSGRSTRERGIEETAFRTNMEAADEVARQLRLRDLAGLIVIDFIDMEVRRNNAAVERRLKDALREDRARIQVGSISHFGLLEMSRQRLRPSIAESSFVGCPHCAGTGFVRGTESSALHVLRAIEEEAGKRKASEILVHAAGSVALYVLNHKRAWLGEIETRHGLVVHLAADESLLPPNLRIDRIRPWLPPAAQEPIAAPVAATPVPIAVAAPPSLDPFASGEADDAGTDAAVERPAAVATDAEPAAEGDENGRRRKRRRRRRGGRREAGADGATGFAGEAGQDADDQDGTDEADDADAVVADVAVSGEQAVALGGEPGDVPDQPSAGENGTAETGAPRGRRRRGGRNRNRGADTDAQAAPDGDAGRQEDGFEAEPVRAAPRGYTGPTPADPFAGSFDIFEMIERDAEEMSAVMTPTAASAASVQPDTTGNAPAAEAPAEPVAGKEPVPVADEADRPGGDAATTAAPTTEPDPVLVVGEAELAGTDAQVTAVPKPRKPRASRARKPAEAAAKPAATAAAEPDAATEATVAPAKARRKPSPRARKAAPAEAVTETPAVETSEPAVPAAEAVEPVAEVPASDPVEPASAQANHAEATAATAPAGIDPSIVRPRVIGEDAPPAARRTGWWKR